LSGVHYWYIDPRSKTVSARPEAPSDTVQFEVPAVVINDCTKLRMFSVWSASKRLKILLPSKEGLAAINLWFTLLDLYELDFFPLLNNLSWRSIAVRLRRWREPVQVVILLLRRVLLRERFSVARIYPLERPQPRA